MDSSLDKTSFSLELALRRYRGLAMNRYELIIGLIVVVLGAIIIALVVLNGL
jgi:hypothetical protein